MKQLVLLLLFATLVQAQTEFSEERATAFLRTLAVEIGPRPMGSPSERRALRFAVTKFMEHGCDTAYVMPFDRTDKVNTSSGIAVGIKRGLTKRIILIGGHIDSSGPEVPGADDDGSGSAVVLELSRVFGRRTMQSTLVFTCFGGEEQGLKGSAFFVDHFADLDSVALMLNIDMANGLGVLDIDGDTYGQSTPSWLMCAAFEEFDKLGSKNMRYPTHAFVMNYSGLGGAGSDHESFLKKGVPAIDFTTDVGKPIHTPRDNFENFDPRGLKRSGDLVARLVERFDAGVPGRQLANYWLYTIGFVRLFVPYWALALFLTVTLLCATAAFVMVRRRRISPVDVKWSGLKMLLFTAIIVAFAWFSPDLVGLVKGYRYAWMSDLPQFYFLAVVFGLLGAWVDLAMARKLPLSACPYVWYKRAAIILAVYTLLFLLRDLELALYPASTLFLCSLAILVKNKVLKSVFALLSPVWMVRFLFNEWIELVFRTTAVNAGYSSSALGLITPALLYVFFTYPLLVAIAAVYADIGTLQPVVGVFRSRWSGLVIATMAVGMIVYLYPRDVYSDLWHRIVHVEQKQKEHDPGVPGSREWKDTIVVWSSEYLDGIRVTRASGDTVIRGRVTRAEIAADQADFWAPGARFAHCTSVSHERNRIERRGDTVTFDLFFRTTCTSRPFTATLTFSSPGKDLLDFSSSSLFTSDGNSRTLRWYSFPDSTRLSVHFSIVGSDSVRMRTEFVFDRIAYPWKFEGERADFIQRYRISSSNTFRATDNLAAKP